MSVVDIWLIVLAAVCTVVAGLFSMARRSRGDPRWRGWTWALILAAVAINVLIALALEVVWFRLLLLYAPSTDMTFAVLLLVMLAGIAIGDERTPDYRALFRTSGYSASGPCSTTCAWRATCAGATAWRVRCCGRPGTQPGSSSR